MKTDAERRGQQVERIEAFDQKVGMETQPFNDGGCAGTFQSLLRYPSNGWVKDPE